MKNKVRISQSRFSPFPNHESDIDKNLIIERRNKEFDQEWTIDNLEHDLRATDWIVEKTRNSENYAQNLYAALCNNEFTKNDVWPILQDKRWYCSWRYAGGIIADMCEEGSYLDWYCSGAGIQTPEFVSEGTVTEEIKEDLLKLGWIVI